MSIETPLKSSATFCLLALLANLVGCDWQDSAQDTPGDGGRVQVSEELFASKHQLDKLYLTERTHKKIIRPGNLAVPFVDRETGEMCWPALVCVNPECPGAGQDGLPYLFIHNDPLVKIGSDGTPAYPHVTAGQDYAQMVADAGGFADATCPACYDKFRRGKVETPEEKSRYTGYVVEYELPAAAQRRWELERQAKALSNSSAGSDVHAIQTQSPAEVFTSEPAATAPPESIDEQQAVELAQQITRPLLKGGVEPKTAEILRRVLKTSKDPQVRISIIAGLGKARDPDSVPQFLDAMEDQSPEMRKVAGAALERTCGFPPLFQPEASPAERQEVIARYRKIWNNLVNAPGQPYLRMMKDPGFKEELGRQALEKLKPFRENAPSGQQ